MRVPHRPQGGRYSETAGRFCFVLNHESTRINTNHENNNNHGLSATGRIRPSANADNTDSVIVFLHSVSFCLSVSIRSLPAVAGNPRSSSLAIRARVLSGSLNHIRVKSAPSVVQIFRQNVPNAQN